MARRKRRRRRASSPKKRSVKKILIGFLIGSGLVMVVLLLGVLAAFFLLPTQVDTSQRTVIAYPAEEYVHVVVLNPNENSVTKINIPNNTYIEASYNLGKWEIGKLWELGKNEGLSGGLLASSITKSLSMPVEWWFEDDSFLRKNLVSKIAHIFSKPSTNATLFDQIRLAFFFNKFSFSSAQEIELAKTGYLTLSETPDRVEVYIVRRNIPASLASLFVYKPMAAGDIKITINNTTQSNVHTEELKNLLSVLGAIVTRVISEDPAVENCLIETKEPDDASVRKLSQLFDCKVELNTSMNQSELIFSYGDEFNSIF